VIRDNIDWLSTVEQVARHMRRAVGNRRSARRYFGKHWRSQTVGPRQRANNHVAL